MEAWDKDFVGDEICEDCGNPLDECECVDEDDLDTAPPSKAYPRVEIDDSEIPF